MTHTKRAVHGFRPLPILNPEPTLHALQKHDRLTRYGQAIGERQAREMRGKADPHGAKPAKDNVGTIAKAEALRDARERVEVELRRREAASQ